MSFILDLQEAIDNLQEVLTKHKHLSKISIDVRTSAQSKSGYMVSCSIASDAFGAPKPLSGNSSAEVCNKVRQRIRARAKELDNAAKSLRKDAEAKEEQAKTMSRRFTEIKLLAPSALTELAMCVEDEDEEPEKIIGFPSLDLLHVRRM